MEKQARKKTCQIRDRHLLVALDRSDDAKRIALYVADFLGGVPGFQVILLTIIQDRLKTTSRPVRRGKTGSQISVPGQKRCS